MTQEDKPVLKKVAKKAKKAKELKRSKEYKEVKLYSLNDTEYIFRVHKLYLAHYREIIKAFRDGNFSLDLAMEILPYLLDVNYPENVNLDLELAMKFSPDDIVELVEAAKEVNKSFLSMLVLAESHLKIVQVIKAKLIEVVKNHYTTAIMNSAEMTQS